MAETAQEMIEQGRILAAHLQKLWGGDSPWPTSVLIQNLADRLAAVEGLVEQFKVEAGHFAKSNNEINEAISDAYSDAASRLRSILDGKS